MRTTLHNIAGLRHWSRADCLIQKALQAHAGEDIPQAYEHFMAAMQVNPAYTYRKCAGWHAPQFTTAVSGTGNAEHFTGWLEVLREEYADINVLCNTSHPIRIMRTMHLRERNIARDLPSLALVTQAKSGSISVSAIFDGGFRLPSVMYSFMSRDVISGWACDYARGGACYTTHLVASERNIARLQAAGLHKIIVHVRDPRQALVSFVHHLDKYAGQLPKFERRIDRCSTVEKKSAQLMDVYQREVQWISALTPAYPPHPEIRS